MHCEHTWPALLQDVSGSTSEGKGGAGLLDVVVTKHDREGRQVWTRLVGTAGAEAHDYAQGLVVDDDGTVYLGAKNASANRRVVEKSFK